MSKFDLLSVFSLLNNETNDHTKLLDEILVKNSLFIETTYVSIVNIARGNFNCNIPNESKLLTKISIESPERIENSILTINYQELYDGNCSVTRVITKSVSPSLATPGYYRLNFDSLAGGIFVQNPLHDFSIHLYPTIRIYADDIKVVDITFNSPTNGSVKINNSWIFLIKP